MHHFECSIDIGISHFSKRPSDLKQNGTQKRHHFLAALNTLSHGLVRFVASASLKTTLWLVEIFWQSIRSLWYSMVFKATPRKKWNTSCERIWKIVPENFLVYHFFRWLGRLERCVCLMLTSEFYETEKQKPMKLCSAHSDSPFLLNSMRS